MNTLPKQSYRLKKRKCEDISLNVLAKQVHYTTCSSALPLQVTRMNNDLIRNMMQLAEHYIQTKINCVAFCNAFHLIYRPIRALTACAVHLSEKGNTKHLPLLARQIFIPAFQNKN